MRKKNDVQIICDNLEKAYGCKCKKKKACRWINKNEIICAREYLEEYSGNDRDVLLKIKAQAFDIDYTSFLSSVFFMFSMIISAEVLLNTITRNPYIIFIASAVFLIIVIGLMGATFKQGYASSWQKYIKVVVEELLERDAEIKNESEDIAEVDK